MKLLLVFGTRPECIKMAPIIKELQRQQIHFKVCVTSQHREMLKPFLKYFHIPVDYNLNIMRYNQDLYYITTQVLLKFQKVLELECPDIVVVQGDTTTTFAAALASFYKRIPVAHVEAGLRTGNIYSPFPEEVNRRLTDHISRWCFAPTERARKNLLREGISDKFIWVTGNTIVDAIQMVTKDRYFECLKLPITVPEGHKLIVVTTHRRENFGKGIENICYAIVELVKRHSDIEIVYPVHLNPNVRRTVLRILNGVERVHLLEPLNYLVLLKLIQQSYLILTDSGGIQEEAPTFRKPVLVLRDFTERIEGIEAGVAKLVGTEKDRIISETERLLKNKKAYKEMCKGINPYGDGKASERIVKILLQRYV